MKYIKWFFALCMFAMVFSLPFACGNKSKLTTPTQSDIKTDLIYTTPEGCKVYDFMENGKSSRVLVCPNNVNGAIQ